MGKSVPVYNRRNLENNIVKFRIALKKAAAFRDAEVNPLHKKVELFQRDVKNIPYHIFGAHSNCDKYFCRGGKANEEDLTTEMIECGLFQDIQKCLQRVIVNTNSCLLNKNNNVAEQFNSLVGKFGGKRVSTLTDEITGKRYAMRTIIESEVARMIGYNAWYTFY